MTDKDWVKVEPVKGEVFDFDKEKSLTGVYIAKEENVGPNASTLYHLESDEGERVSVWGNAVLDSRFSLIKPGMEVKIEYLGKVASQKGGREYRNYEVFYREAPFKKAGNEEELDVDQVSADMEADAAKEK